jgi:hypothetical protein
MPMSFGHRRAPVVSARQASALNVSSRFFTLNEADDIMIDLNHFGRAHAGRRKPPLLAQPVFVGWCGRLLGRNFRDSVICRPSDPLPENPSRNFLLGTGLNASQGETPSAWWLPDKFGEDACKVRLGLEANRQRDIYDRHARFAKQFLCALDAAAKHVFVWAQARRRTKLRCEMHARETRCRG